MTHQTLLSILFVFLVSCKNKTNTVSIIETKLTNLDTNGILQKRFSNKIDTLIYRPLKFDFYRNSNGDIFESKKYNEEDSLGIYQALELDSTLVDGEYSNRQPIRKYLDINTYTEDTVSSFSKDKNYVYYIRAQSGGHIRFIVDKADPKTFIGLKDRWGKDKNYVFYNQDIVDNADVKTFRVYRNSNDTAKDKNHIYYCGEIIKSLLVSNQKKLIHLRDFSPTTQ